MCHLKLDMLLHSCNYDSRAFHPKSLVFCCNCSTYSILEAVDVKRILEHALFLYFLSLMET